MATDSINSIGVYASIGFIALGTIWLRWAPDRESIWMYLELRCRANRMAARTRKDVLTAGLEGA